MCLVPFRGCDLILHKHVSRPVRHVVLSLCARLIFDVVCVWVYSIHFIHCDILVCVGVWVNSTIQLPGRTLESTIVCVCVYVFVCVSMRVLCACMFMYTRCTLGFPSPISLP